MKGKPFWTDHCEHPEDGYMGTVNDTVGVPNDVYLYRNGESIHICFRYGERGEDYISPPPLVDLMSMGVPAEYLPMVELARKEMTLRVIAGLTARSIGTGDNLFAELAVMVTLGLAGRLNWGGLTSPTIGAIL